jgi:N utilization substance protein A
MIDPDKVLKLPGIGPKAMQNIEETLAAVTFPEPTPPAQPEVAPVPEAESTPEAQAAAVEPVSEAEAPVVENQVPAKKEARRGVEEEEDEHAKDGVSLDELFSMKPEIFQSGQPEEESSDKKKGKKVKKKTVELEFDEERGEVVARKKHKRGDEHWGEE